MSMPINFNKLNAQVKGELKAEKQKRIDQFALAVLPAIYRESVEDIAKEAYAIAEAMEDERTRLMNED